MSAIDVLIVGAGPTGLTLALELAAERIPFRIIDKVLKASELSRGLMLQLRTLELLNRHADVRTGLMARGIENFGTTIWMNRKPILKTVVTQDIQLLNTAFTWPILISQHKLELFMVDALAKLGFEVERGVAARDITQNLNGVSVIVEKSDGTNETLRAKYVVGCDGSRSVVRCAAKAINFVGHQFSQVFMLCDASIDSSNSATNLTPKQMHVCIGDGMLVSFPLENGKRRIFATRTNDYLGKDLSLQEFQSSLAKFLPDGDKMLISDPDWLSVFNVHHKIADKYRDGKLLVAGDAAHIHSPAGGQGGNTSIQDAVNLGWKLEVNLDSKPHLQPKDAENIKTNIYYIR
ncbi:FAD-binding monooxygenase [Halenospora varia]|nr:FAD-binding monooxygenase [Halenospora varia]